MPYIIDFLPVGTKSSSGDAIALRYGSPISGYSTHIVDGGYADTAPGMIDLIRFTYGTSIVTHVVLTHADGDHAAGLVEVLETLTVQALWMNRPWLYASEIIHHFHGNWTLDGLVKHLREQYPTLVELEDIAVRRGIPIYEVFQGAQVGAFTILAPSRARYLALLPDFDKTPERMSNADSAPGVFGYLIEAAKSAIRWIVETWQGETLSENPEPTTASNESSIVQMATIDGDQIVLTGDVGPEGLHEAAHYAEQLGFHLQPRFIQVPHHGSRRNVTPSALNRWLGPIRPEGSLPNGHAYCSAAELDEDHPRQKVKNAFIRRGYSFAHTKGKHIWFQSGMGRTGYPLQLESFSSQVEE